MTHPDTPDHLDPVEVANWPDFVPTEWPEEVEEPASSWTPIDIGPTLEGLLDGTVQPPRHDVGPIEGGGYLLTSGAVSAIFGGPASGKTWTALRIVADVITQGERAMFIDLEDHAQGVLSRLLQLGVASEELILRFDYISPAVALTELDRAALLEVIEAARPTLVVIDSTGEALAGDGLNGNDDTDVARWFARLPKAIAALGPAVLTLDHTPKNGPESGKRYAIGSQRKLASLDGAGYRQDMATPFSKDRPGHATLTATKDRQGEYVDGQRVAELHVTPFPGPEVAPGLNRLHVSLRATSEGSGKPFRPTELMERVSRVLESSARPLSVRAIRETVTGKGVVISAALECLTAEGYVTTEEGPRGATLHASARPYREADDIGTEPEFLPCPHRVPPYRGRDTGHGQTSTRDTVGTRWDTVAG